MATATSSQLRAVVLAACLLGCHAKELVLPEPPPVQAPCPSGAVMPPATAPGDVPESPPPAGIELVLEQVDPSQLRVHVDRLAGFGTRNTLSDTVSPVRGIGAARRYIAERMGAAAVARGGAPALQVSLDTHAVRPDGKRIDRALELVNVVATLPGTRVPARHVYVVAHYDSRASDVMNAEIDAPGANDDGSGTALLLELARVLAPRMTDATVVLLATAGEEQGLVGARAHAAAARARGIDIAAVLSFDIVGDPQVPGAAPRRDTIRVFSEGLPLAADDAAIAALRRAGAEHDAPSRQLARYVATVAAWQGTAVRPQLVFRPDRLLRGGDHTAFAEQGYPAIRFTEPGEHYDRQHQDVRDEAGHAFGDVPEHVDPHYLAEVTRLAAATVLQLANAPASPGHAHVVETPLGHDTTLRWDPVADDDLAAYEVLWRETTAAQWQHVQAVGDGTTVTLPLHRDDWHFGVRTVDRDGYRSPVAACGVTPPR